MDGKVHHAAGAGGVAAPVQMSAKAGDRSIRFGTGSYWIKLDGAWLIVSR